MLRKKYRVIFACCWRWRRPACNWPPRTIQRPSNPSWKNCNRLPQCQPPRVSRKYRYANAGQPGKYIDSLAGEIQLDKNRSRFVIDGTETVVTEKYSINISNDTKLFTFSTAKRSVDDGPRRIAGFSHRSPQRGRGNQGNTRRSRLADHRFSPRPGIYAHPQWALMYKAVISADEL